MKPGIKYWESTICGNPEPVDPQDSYEVGDHEPCIYCDDLRCRSVVKQGSEICIVVGSSPSHEYNSNKGK